MRCCSAAKSSRPSCHTTSSPSTTTSRSSSLTAPAISGKYRVSGRCCRDGRTARTGPRKATQRNPSHFGAKAHLPGWTSGSAWAASARTGRSGYSTPAMTDGLDTQGRYAGQPESEAVDQRWRSPPERARISPYRCLQGAEVATTALRVQLPQLAPPATPREDPCPVRPVRRERAAGDPGRIGPSVATISGPRRRRPNLRAR
jgi:hypothetical protein